MTDGGPASPAGEPRVSTGCPPLDTMLHGGLVARRPYLVVGPSGTGKTTLTLQFLCDGVRRGEKGLLVTLEEPPNEMRLNHRNLAPDIDHVYVFDAIPDVMRYERAPFKDISAVRQSVRFSDVPSTIRKTAELSSVEVTFTALEQMLKMEMARQHYQRLVIDSLTALQYFCMKGFDETLGAQTFLRFLSDLHVTTLLTVEAPLEDTESPERLLARGEVRLFRWEHDGLTVRAVGVEKFRGSEHDIRLHPYRITPRGIDITLGVTISRDTQELLGPSLLAPAEAPGLPPAEVYETGLEALVQDSRDLVELQAETAAFRATVLEALAASERSPPEEVARIIARARGRVFDAALAVPTTPTPSPAVENSLRRLRGRAIAARAGIPPAPFPDPATLRATLEHLLRILDRREAPTAPAAPPPAPPTPPAPPAPPTPTLVPAAVPPRAPPPPPPAAVGPRPVPTAPPETPRPATSTPAEGAASEPGTSPSPTTAAPPSVAPPARPASGPPGVSRERERPAPPPLPNVAVPIPPPVAPTSRPEPPTVSPPSSAASPPPAVPGAEAAPEVTVRRRKRATATADGAPAPRRRRPKVEESPAPSVEVATAPSGDVPPPAAEAPPKPRRRAPRKKPADPPPAPGGTTAPPSVAPEPPPEPARPAASPPEGG